MANLPERGSEDVLYLVDLSYWTRTAFHAGGERAIVRTVESKLERLFEARLPRLLGFAVDSREPTWHRQLWSGYHASRQDPGDVFWKEQGIAVDAIREKGLEAIVAPGFAADDIVASVSDAALRGGLSVVIVAGDRDLWQVAVGPGSGPPFAIVWDGVSVHAVGDDDCASKLGLPPRLLPDAAALAGVKEQAPGIPSIGWKTAVRLVQSYGSADDVIGIAARGSLVKETPRMTALINAHADAVRLGLRLSVLRRDAPVRRNDLRAAYGTERYAASIARG